MGLLSPFLGGGGDSSDGSTSSSSDDSDGGIIGAAGRFWDNLAGDPAGTSGGTTTTDPPSESPLAGGTKGGSSSTDSGGGFTLPSVLQRFADNPKGFILGIVAVWIVGGILRVAEIGVEALLIIGDVLRIIPNTIRDVVLLAGRSIGAPFVELAVELNDALVEATASLGPFGAIIVPAVYLALAIGLVKLAAWIADLIEIPILDLGAILRGVTFVPRVIWRVIRG